VQVVVTCQMMMNLHFEGQTMNKYRRKPDVVDVVRLTKPFDGFEMREDILGYYIEVETPGGSRLATEGDYIITNAKGEKTICTPAVFEQWYEPVEDEPCQTKKP